MDRPGAERTIGDEFRLDEDRPDRETIVFALYGETDLHVAGELKDRLEEAIDEGASALVLDLTGVTFIDSMALGVLLGSMKRLEAKGGRFRVVAPRSEVRRIFELTLLDRVFEIDETRRQALAATGNGSAAFRGER